MQPCSLCPRGCNIQRDSAAGRCNETYTMRIARAAPHLWEEPCLSGTQGSGTVFFSGCPLGCIFCQNQNISLGGAGQPTTQKDLIDIFINLQNQGVHNINLVTATHFWPQVLAAVKKARLQGLYLPIVWNTGGYESINAIQKLAGQVSIWLTDLKFYSPQLSAQLAQASDYFAVASAAAQRMCALSGPPLLDSDGIMQRGTIIRLLVLPRQREDAKKLLHWMAQNLPKDGFLLSLMSQYTPPPGSKLAPPLNRRISTYEYNDVVDTAMQLGLINGFMQQRSSAKEEYTPPFDGTGLPK
ncbi:MAG: 4Fe-4S cluster-binding domain-containing protein [Oscillospiraceae bacterium]